LAKNARSSSSSDVPAQPYIIALGRAGSDIRRPA
jgi:hypothetical protein